MVRNTMSYSLGAAAAATGLNKTSILRAIKNGKISGTKDALGQWWVEPAELHRVPKPAREHVRLVPDKIYPGMWRVVGPSGTLSDMVNKTRAQDVAWRLAESMVSNPHLGSLSGCRSDRSKSWPKALCPKFAGRESDAGWRIGLRNVSPHEQGGCHIDCGATDATASSVDLALR
jgi:hypothetical protein